MPKPLPRWNSNVETLREFSEISLIVADLDGTLVPTPDPAMMRELSNSLRGRRYRVDMTIATGRTYHGVQRFLSALPIKPGMPLILYNGSVIVKNQTLEILNRRTISSERLRTILNLTIRQQMPTFAYLYDQPLDGWFSSPISEEYVLGWSCESGTKTEFNDMSVHCQEYGPGKQIKPSAILIDVGGAMDDAEQVNSKLRRFGDITTTRSGSQYIEIRPKGSNKGTAIKRVAKSLGLSANQILALGDNDNDAEMLAWAGIGVAIANASESALQSSNYVCRYGVFRGAVEVMRIIKNAKRYFWEQNKKAAG